MSQVSNWATVASKKKSSMAGGTMKLHADGSRNRFLLLDTFVIFLFDTAHMFQWRVGTAYLITKICVRKI